MKFNRNKIIVLIFAVLFAFVFSSGALIAQEYDDEISPPPEYFENAGEEAAEELLEENPVDEEITEEPEIIEDSESSEELPDESDEPEVAIQEADEEPGEANAEEAVEETVEEPGEENVEEAPEKAGEETGEDEPDTAKDRPAENKAQKGGNFGSKDPGLYNLKGNLYFLSEDIEEMPADIEAQPSQGVIYTQCLDIPERSFTEGFPGVTDRFEFFGLIYKAKFQVDKPGKYGWTLVSDDGSRLWIDGKEVVNNDGVHGLSTVSNTVDLKAGLHDIKIWFFQGPADYLGIQLFIEPPGEEKRIFNIAEFSKGLQNSIAQTNAEATKKGIKINFDAAVLFDSGKFVLKPTAAPTIKSAAELISAYPQALVKIHGHTDSVGSDKDNQKLSENRADAVKNALLSAGIPASIRFEIAGFGENSPVATNDNEKGRRKNRRVELYIQP